MRVLDSGRIRESGTDWRTAGGNRVHLQEHGQFARDGRRLTSQQPSYSWRCTGCGRVSAADTDDRRICDEGEQHARACAV